ncbi:glycosyltransferase family protein [Paenibacillus glycinis]|uniref:Glycosyltransferase n=1 Tax=Paenibacillus glycinis TaxID=2697035 RepID=A0ABW9XVI3_9BACL|nr:glycosyltransferase [Paenibacillus glycinis]NBD26694.1 glycosyltransferase [Paenibacillus glycinis]
MSQFVFPYRSIEAGSRIVLYAAGDVGQHYYRQLQATGYCEVVLWVDRMPYASNVHLPETIATLSSDEYDWVVIAIERIELIESIKNFLITLGVPLHKIVDKPPAVIPLISRYSRLTLREWLEDTSRVKNEMLSYFARSEGQIYYFESLIQEMKGSCQYDKTQKSVVQHRAIQLIENELISTEMRLVLLRLLLEADCFDKRMMRLFVKYIGELRHNSAQKYWLINDVSSIWMHYADILYEDFWLDKQRVMKDYAEELALSWNPSPYRNGSNRTLCVLTVGFDFDSPIKFTSPITKELLRRNYQVHVIDLLPFRNDSGANFLQPKYPLLLSGISPDQYDRIQTYYPEPIHLHYPNSVTMRDRQQEILDLISSINPFGILDLSDELGFISSYYYQDYPTIHLPVRKVRESSSFFHRFVIPSNLPIDVQAPIREDQVLPAPFLVEYVSPKREFKRNEYGFLSDDILVVTVGHRLNVDINPELVDKFCTAMCANPKVKWICVGPDEHRYMVERYSSLIGKQIYLWGYEDDLPALYGMCDIYLNPQRFGGGLSIAWAMQQGLALASPLGADAAMMYAGEELAVQDEKELVSYVMDLANSPGLLSNNQAIMRRKAAEWSIERFVDALIEGMVEIAEEFEAM